MAKILIGYELGSGFGHVKRLASIAKALIDNGHEIVFFLRNIREAAVVLNNEALPILPVPDMVTRPPGLPHPARLGCYSDIMAHSGFFAEASLYVATLAWKTMFRQVKPDLIICDHSPVCCLAAFDGIPVMQIADGFTLPPAQEAVFPPFRPNQPVLVDPQLILDNMRAVRRRLGGRPPETVTEPFRTAERLVCTLPELDPYTDLRRDPVIGPAEGVQPPLPPPERAHFFAYLSLEHKATTPILKAIAKSTTSGEIVARGMTGALAKELTRPGLQVHLAPQPIEQVLARSSLVIHHGGNGTTCAALGAGRPQITLPTHQESRLTTDTLVRLGVARHPTKNDHDKGLGHAVDIVAADEGLAARAREVAADIQGRGPWHAQDRIVEAALAMLNGNPGPKKKTTAKRKPGAKRRPAAKKQPRAKG